MNVKPTRQSPLSSDAAVQLLKTAGITPTQQRLKIAAILFASEQHVAAEDLLEQVNQGACKVSKATIYNTLGLFAQHGLVREVIVDPSKVFYDSNTRAHQHFYNICSGELTDIEVDTLEIGRLPDLPAGTVLDGVDVIVRVKSLHK